MELDVYRLSIGYVAWVYEKAADLNGVHRSARDPWLRARQSIPLTIAEGIDFEFEMAEINENAALNQSLKAGLRDAKEKQGRFV